MKKSTGILLVNTGTPLNSNPKWVSRYLKEFLSDREIVDLPAWLWQPVLKTILLPQRAPKSAKKYDQIWQPEGSPLLTGTKVLAAGLEAHLANHDFSTFIVRAAMRYGEPSLDAQLEYLADQGVDRIVVFPLFPQSSFSTTGSIKKCNHPSDSMKIQFVDGYASHPAYIQALAIHLEKYWQDHARAERLIFSFHGVPLKLIRKGDSYQRECYQTVHALVEKLSLPKGSWEISFQSRFGPAKWLTPATRDRVQSAAHEGVSSLQVFAPGFAVDCLETLHEINIEMRDLYHQQGGKSFGYIPALNSSSAHIHALADILLGLTI